MSNIAIIDADIVGKKKGTDMKILTATQMKKLMGEFPNGGIVFAEYIPNMPASSLMVTDGNFGAREVVPRDGGVFDFDWNIDEYEDERQFAVFDNNDILQMIQTLTSGLKIHLKDWFEDDETEHDFINDRMTERFNKRQKIYAISKGAYSDYHIIALTTDKNKAERLRDMYSGKYDVAVIQEYDDGDIEIAESHWRYDTYDDSVEKISRDSPDWTMGEYATNYEAYVIAPDVDHARKKAQDLIAAHKALRAGL